MVKKRKFVLKNYCFIGVSLLMFIFLSIPQVSHGATAQELISRYTSALKTGQKINILVVPGHDDDYWGTSFGDIREGDITVAIGQFLYTYLKSDPHINVIISRTQMGYSDTFSTYFANNADQIRNFISTSQASFKQQIVAGSMSQNEVVPHATANSTVVMRLYGINKWANENNIDLVIHIHVNDEGGRMATEVGPYKGFTVYVPDKEYSNGAASLPLGQAIHDSLIKKYPSSTYPPEAGGLIQDQELIAIGAANTLKPAAALIEYGYIYEPQFLNVDNRDTVTKAYAYQTYAGIESFFGAKIPSQNSVGISSLPHVWNSVIKKGSTGADVSALQAALTKENVYSCGVTGTFGPCTEAGVKAFQKKYLLEQTGALGPKTRGKLNSLFSS